MWMNEHCACRFASSVAPSVESEDSVSVMGKAPPTGFWRCVTQTRRLGFGATFALGSHGELFTAADTTLITPLFEITPVSGFDVRLLRTDSVRKPLCVSTHPQHSAIC